MKPTTNLHELQLTEETSSGLLTLAQATKSLPRRNGKRVHTSTLWRWCRQGCRGIRLQYYRAGRTILISQEMLEQFFLELAQADQVQVDQPKPRKRRQLRTNSTREKALEEAHAILKRAGILV